MLEAVIIASVMLSAIAFVSTFEPTGSSLPATDRMITQKLEDFLATADDMLLRNRPCEGSSVLERLVIDGVQGDDEEWDARRHRLLGDGIHASMYISNGRHLYPLHDDDDFMGNTARRTIQPEFNFVMPIESTAVTGTERLDIDVAAVFQGELVRLKGDAVRTSILAAGAAGERSYSAWGTGALLGPAESATARHAQEWFTWVDKFGIPQLVRNIDGSAISQGDEIALYLRISPGLDAGMTPNDVIPAGIQLRVAIPAGWDLQSELSAYDVWAEIEANEEVSGSTLLLRAEEDITEPSTILLTFIPPSSPVRAFDTFHARLSHGSFSESTLVVKYPLPAERDLPRFVYPTTPYSLRPASSALFGAAFTNGGDATVVSRVDIEIPGGYDVWQNGGAGAELFAPFPDEFDVDPVTGERVIFGQVNEVADDEVGDFDKRGSWRFVDAKHVVWIGNRSVDALSATFWTVNLPITTDASQATSIEPENSAGPYSTLGFSNNYNDTSTRWNAAPGIFHHSVLPETTNPSTLQNNSDGYDVNESAYSLTARSTRAYLHGTGEYGITANPLGADALRLQNAVANSSFTVRDRAVRLGNLLQVDVDIESMMTTLGSMGVAGTTLTVDLYAPPSMGCEPTATWSKDDSTLPHAALRFVRSWTPTTGGVNYLYAGAEDNVVYAVPTTGLTVGVPSWSRDVGATPLVAATASDGAQKSLLVGDSRGRVHSYDAITGEPRWTTCVSGGGCQLETGRIDITALDHDATTGRIVAATKDGRLSFLDTTGTKLYTDIAQLEEFTEAAFGPQGAAYAVRVDSSLTRYAYEDADNDGDLEFTATTADYAVDHVAPATDTVYATDYRDLIKLDPTSLASLEVHDYESLMTPTDSQEGITHLLTADFDQDGASDALLTLPDTTLVMHRADGTTAYHRPATTEAPTNPHGLSFLPSTKNFEGSCPPVATTPNGGTYTQPTDLCEATLREGNAHPHLLSTDGTTIQYVSSGGNALRLDRLDTNLDLTWTTRLAQGRTPLDLDSGPLQDLLGTHDTVILGNDDGTIDFWNEDDITKTWTLTQFAGKFTFQARVPGSGFFGSHILIMTLEWTDTANIPRSAHLTDWFEAVDAQGMPMTKPFYHVLMVAEDGSQPFVPSS